MHNPLPMILALAALPPLAHAAVTSQQWNFSLDLGASYASGNTDTTLLTVGLKGERDAESDHYSFSLAYAFGEADGATTSESLLGEAAWKHLISERWFAGLRLDLRRDDLADIDYRVTTSAPIGYFFIKNDDTRLHVEAGPGFTAEETGSMSTEYFSIFLGQQLRHQLNEMTSIYQSISITAPAEDFNDFQLVAEAGLETKLTENMNFKVAVEEKYENEPAPGRTENDIRLVTGVALKF